MPAFESASRPLTLESAALGTDPLAVSAELLDKADVYIGILAFRYGFVPEAQERSLTQIEFERAGSRGIPRLIFLMSEDHPVRVTDVEIGPGAEKLRDFKALARREVLVTEFRSPDELKAAVVTGLVEVCVADCTADKRQRRYYLFRLTLNSIRSGDSFLTPCCLRESKFLDSMNGVSTWCDMDKRYS